MASSCTPGDLVFDIGAHVGDRVAAFRRLGARVVAVEPQPALGEDPAPALRARQGRHHRGGRGRARERHVALQLNLDNPDGLHGVRRAFIQAADGAPGWHGQAWTKSIRCR